MKKEPTTKSVTDTPWVMDRAWISGVASCLALIAAACWFHIAGILDSGIRVGQWRLTDNRTDSVLFGLLCIISTTVLCEMIRIYRFYGASYFQLDPKIRQKRYLGFLVDCAIKYIEVLVCVLLIIVFFRTAGEYGFSRQAPFYQPWFRLLDIIFQGYLWLGYPYFIITRALHWNKQADLASFSILSARLGGKPWQYAKSFLRTWILRLLFAPLVTVFFTEQFSSLVNHIDYLINQLPSDLRHENFNRGIFRSAASLLLSIHMAVAACGYFCVSRWLKNDINKVNPWLLAWIVCLLSFPPFKLALTWYFPAPGEHSFLFLNIDFLVSILGAVFIAMLSISLSATLCFGMRFSDLTNRGIIRTGPYRWVRHPAYSTHLISLWVTALPLIATQWDSRGFAYAGSLSVALCLITWIYYLRAVTEERHLSADSQYQEYCQNTPFRFIPRVL